MTDASNANMSSRIEIWDISKIIPYAANAKKHSEEQVKKLAKAITAFGWTQPIVVAGNGEIIAGHGRRLAAIHLNLKRVPVIVRSDLTKAEADALRLADNRVSSTDYDQELIQTELQRLNKELSETNIDLTDLGFDIKEISFSLSDLGEIDDSVFVNDITEAVETQNTTNSGVVKMMDESAAPVVDALGFKRVTIAQSRQIKEAMVRCEIKTGKTGVDALIEVLSAV